MPQGPADAYRSAASAGPKGPADAGSSAIEAVRVLAVAENALIGQGLATLLRHHGFACTYEPEHAARRALTCSPVDLVVWYAERPNRAQWAQPPQPCRILVVTSTTAGVFAALRAGAHGVLQDTASAGQLVASVAAVADGGSVLPRRTPLTLANNAPSTVIAAVARRRLLDARLTPRELQILAFMAKGKSNEEIAEAYFLARATVKSYVSSILHKTGTRDRLQVVVLVLQAGLEGFLSCQSYESPGKGDVGPSP